MQRQNTASETDNEELIVAFKTFVPIKRRLELLVFSLKTKCDFVGYFSYCPNPANGSNNFFCLPGVRRAEPLRIHSYTEKLPEKKKKKCNLHVRSEKKVRLSE